MQAWVSCAGGLTTARDPHALGGEHDTTDTLCPITVIPCEGTSVSCCLLIEAAGGPEVRLGDFSGGVCAGPDARLPRSPALYPVDENGDYQLNTTRSITWVTKRGAAESGNANMHRSRHSRAASWMYCAIKTSQVLRMLVKEVKNRYPDLVVASLGAIKKHKSSGAVTGSVLFDGTNGIGEYLFPHP